MATSCKTVHYISMQEVVKLHPWHVRSTVWSLWGSFWIKTWHYRYSSNCTKGCWENAKGWGGSITCSYSHNELISFPSIWPGTGVRTMLLISGLQPSIWVASTGTTQSPMSPMSPSWSCCSLSSKVARSSPLNSVAAWSTVHPSIHMSWLVDFTSM